VLNIINIKNFGSAMDEDLNPNVKVRGSNLHSIIPKPFGLS
jgi:hypothetical protein